MAKNTCKFISLVLALAMLTTLLPAGLIVSAEGETDTTLSGLTYTFNGTTQVISLADDDDKGAGVQENRYSITLPYITKTYSADRLPTVDATVTAAGATATVTDIASFPGTAKIIVTASDGLTKRNYYVHFKYASGNFIGDVTNKVTTTGNVYKAFHDLQPMSLADLRELYLDLGPNYSKWKNYCSAYVDRALSVTGNAIVDVASASSGSNIPSTLVPLQSGKTGDYVNYYQTGGSGYFSMWMGTGTSSGNASRFFNGASWIATGNNDKATAYMQGAYDDAITFSIDRGATIWVGAKAALPNFLNYGWTYNTTSGYKLYHGDGNGFVNYYTKHFNAGEVKIPTAGAATAGDRMYMPIVMWDAPGTGDTSLATLSATWEGGSKNITLVPGQTIYDMKLDSVPTFSASTTDSEAQLDIVQGTGVPGTTTITVLSGANTTVYTVNYTLEGQSVIYADKTNTTGASGVGYTVVNTAYPTVPTYDQFSGASPINEPNVGTIYWDFGDGNGPIAIPRSYSNYGGNIPTLRNEGRGLGSSQYVYVKMDISDLDPSRSVQQASLSFSPYGTTRMDYNGTNKSLFVDVYEVAETNWISGTGLGEMVWTGTAPNKNARTGIVFFPLKHKTNGIILGDVSQPHPLTAVTAPDNTTSEIAGIATAAYSKKIGTIYVGEMGLTADYGTITVDVTKSVRDKLAAGKTTATFRLSITQNIYGYNVSGSAITKNDMNVAIRSSGATAPRLDITSTVSGDYASGENKLAYIAIGNKASYTNGSPVFAPGKTPIDFAAGFEQETTSEQIFNITTADLISGSVGLDAVSQDANASVSINGAVATVGNQYALVTPVQGVATAQVTVTAPNTEALVYNLKFIVTDYAVSTDSTLSELFYTHQELGKQSIALTQGINQYNVELPYGLSTQIPQIGGVPNHMYGEIASSLQPTQIPGSATITVRAESGAQSTYTINFTRSSTPPAAGVGTVTNLKYRGVDAVDPFMAVTGLQGVEPVNIMNDNVNYPTQADKTTAAANPLINLYRNDDLRMYSDRSPGTGGGNGSSLSQQIYSQMEFALIVKGEEATSPEFVGPNVTRILTKNDEKNKTDSIPNAYTFTIDKPATVYIAWGSHSAPSANILSNGWKLDNTGLQVARASISSMQYTQGENADNKYYAIPNGAYNSYNGVYTKHYVAGANVEIPSTGGGNSGLVVLIIWDTVPKQQITNLTLNTPTNLYQSFGQTASVHFRAAATPYEDVDRSVIEWYVNGIKQSTTGANFSYNPTNGGNYVVAVKLSGGDTVFDTKTITVVGAGDISGDGVINITDVIMAAEIAVGYPNYTAEQISRANVSSKTDSTIDISDVVLIVERVAGPVTPFPVER